MSKASSIPMNQRGLLVVRRLALYMILATTLLTVGLVIMGVDHWYYVLPGFPIFFAAYFIANTGRHLLARDIVLLGSFALFTFWAFTHRRVGGEYGLIAVFCSLPMVQKSNRTLIPLLVLVGSTLAIYIVYDRVADFTPNATINYPLLSTTALLLAGGNVFFQILLYRNTLLKYLSAFKLKNDELDQALVQKQAVETVLQQKNNELRLLSDQLNWIVQQKTIELQAYIDAINVSIYSTVSDLHGIFIDVNKKVAEISGYSREELIGRHYKMLSSGRYPDSYFHDRREKLKDGKPWRGEVEHKSKNGSLIWFDCVIIPMQETDGSIKRFLTLGMPITERKLHEVMLSETNKLLEAIVFRTSHSIRGPMARITGLSNLIENGYLDESEYKTIASKFSSCTAELNVATTELINFVYDHKEWLNNENDRM